MTKIDPELPVRTRDGRPVQIITTEGRVPGLPVVGYIGNSKNLTCWDVHGKWGTSIAPHDLDLDLVQDREVWVNIYDQDFLAVFPSKDAAMRSTKTPIARVRVPYTPGQFDD